ncbi:MAG: LysM peptidoglycan-binding domain-containing protein [Bacteroidales bacterium]|nr:LysM peptidoglycan-binding domain-containing protein [Bacteroidales bacterium]
MKRTTLILIFFSIIFNYSFAQTDTVITEKSSNKVIIGGKGYYVHIVKKSETLFSLSKVYNVSQKDIAKENPEIFLGLQIGQALKIPIVDNKSDKDKILSNDYIYHRVKKGQTLYSLARKYNVSQEDIMACNPTVRYGINVDQIVKIPKSKDVVEALRYPVNDTLKDTIKIIDKYIYHIVEKKETIYSLIRFYEITEDILLEHNPLVSEGLKLGQVLKIPKVEDIESSIVMKSKEELADTVLYRERAQIAYSDSAYLPDCKEISENQTEPYKVALLLPLYLNKNDEEFYIDSSEVDDYRKKIYKKIFYDPYYIYPRSVAFVEFYQGFMLAVDSLKQQGLSINLHVFDTQNDTARIKEILNFPEFENNDLIIGPMYNHEVKLVSEYSKENQIKMISPLSDDLNLVNENPYLFQVKPSYNSQIDEFAKFVSNFGDKNIVLVHNGDSLGYSNVQMVKDKIFNNLSIDTLINNIQFKEVVFEDSINVLEHALNDELENVFIIPSNDEAFVTDVLTNLNTIKMYGHKVRVIGLSRWPRFKNIDPEYYFNLELCIASPFFIDFHNTDVKDFILKFRDEYSTEPNQMAIHAYDVGLYFLSALLNYGDTFERCIYNHKVDLLQADYNFVKWYEYSGFENTNVDIIKYYDGYNIFRIDDFKKEIDTLSQSDEF